MEKGKRKLIFISLFFVIAIVAILLIVLNSSKDKEKIEEKLTEEVIITKKVEKPIEHPSEQPIVQGPSIDNIIDIPVVPTKPTLIISMQTLLHKEVIFSAERRLAFNSIAIDSIYDNERISFSYPNEIPTEDVIDFLINISSLLSITNLDYVIEDGSVEIEHYGMFEKEEIEETLDKIQAYFDSIYPPKINKINLMGYTFSYEINDEGTIITGTNGIDQEIASDYIVSLYSNYKDEMNGFDFELGDDYIMALYPEESKDSVLLFIESLR